GPRVYSASDRPSQRAAVRAPQIMESTRLRVMDTALLFRTSQQHMLRSTIRLKSRRRRKESRVLQYQMDQFILKSEP
ncbi:hypothetical protein ATANTOWER_013450, partial [Ataeniobius toweri]|nr:hypothetical protein [Ataeniobius toweri]